MYTEDSLTMMGLASTEGWMNVKLLLAEITSSKSTVDSIVVVGFIWM